MDGTQGAPTWSPDGAKLAFTTAEYDIYVVDADGANLTALAPHASGDADPVWSPLSD
jgi:TolB protein